MKKCTVLLLLFLLTGCTGTRNALETGMELRSKLLRSSGCSFAATITADYGDKVHLFSMECISDGKGDMAFTVTQPESISGITGKITAEGGNLTFDETLLSFDLMAEDQLSPVSAPWIFMKTLRGGNLTSACEEEGIVRLSADDSYAENSLGLDIWLDEGDNPARAEILFDGRRILSVAVDNFQIV